MKITRNYQYLVPATDHYVIYVVGVGGTGSHVAYDMARLVSHGRSRGVGIDLVLVDPDTVEEKNVGRQRFTRAEIGMNKAHARASSLSRWLGIPVTFIANTFGGVDRFAHGILRKTRYIVVGCLDDSYDNEGRRQIALTLHDGHDVQRPIWIDSGNDRYSGQVAVGSALAGDRITVNRAVGMVSGLPAPCVSVPQLLDSPTSDDEDEMSCAELTAVGEQSLFVNSTMAGIVSQYVFDIVFRHRLQSLLTYVNLSPAPNVQSVLINDDSLAKHSQGIEIKG